MKLKQSEMISKKKNTKRFLKKLLLKTDFNNNNNNNNKNCLYCLKCFGNYNNTTKVSIEQIFKNAITFSVVSVKRTGQSWW